MDTGLDDALSDSLDGMEYLFNRLWSFFSVGRQLI